jgi:hypothetical protein
MANQPPSSPPSPGEFLLGLLNAVHELTGRRPPPTWTHVDKVQTRLATGNRDALDAAIRLAAARRWLRVDGDPPASITLTGDGLKFLQAAKPT